MKPNQKGTAQIFKNPFLEKLTRTHIALPISIFLMVAFALIFYGFLHGFLNILSAIGLFLVGWFIFTFLEYVAHRYLFHMETDSKIKESIQYKFHGVHHDYPKDKERLAMPPIISMFISSLFFFIFRLLFGQFVFGIVSGLLFGYAVYLFVHYAVHTFAPPKSFFKYLWVHHSIHHYKTNNRAFGVSSPLWDQILGTMPERKNQK